MLLALFLRLSNNKDGAWRKHYFCAKCDHEVTWHQMMHSNACCPYCGHTVPGTVMGTVSRSMRWVSAERKWWQVWRVSSGTFEEKTST